MTISYLTFSKFAEEISANKKDKSSTYGSLAKIVGLGALGIGAGTGAGLLIGHGSDKAYEYFSGKRIPKNLLVSALPLLGGAAGVAYSVHKAREKEAIRRALENSSDY